MDSLSPRALRPIVWERHRVITTELLANLYGAQVANIQKNYERNLARFQGGRHFFKVEGEDLKSLRTSMGGLQTGLQPSLSRLQISPKARSLMLWTERGAMQHAKMLETETAWKVFESLVDLYFAKKAERLRSTAADRSEIAHAVIDIGLDRRVSPSIVQGHVNRWAGVPRSRSMSVKQVIETEGYCDRLRDRVESPEDMARFTANSLALHGDDGQMSLQLIAPQKEEAPSAISGQPPARQET